MSLIFEQNTPPSYSSNDGRLLLQPVRIGHSRSRALTPQYTFTLLFDGEAVLSTESRVLVDAYIAGYDLASVVDATELAIVRNNAEVEHDENCWIACPHDEPPVSLDDPRFARLTEVTERMRQQVLDAGSPARVHEEDILEAARLVRALTSNA